MQIILNSFYDIQYIIRQNNVFCYFLAVLSNSLATFQNQFSPNMIENAEKTTICIEQFLQSTINKTHNNQILTFFKLILASLRTFFSQNIDEKTENEPLYVSNKKIQTESNSLY